MNPFIMLLDTDIGDDIDDAFALAFSVNHPGIELVAVTTVFKHTKARAQQAKALLDALGHPWIPVHPGITTPLKEPIHYFDKDVKDENGVVMPCQYDEAYASYNISQTDAVSAIIGLSHTYDKDLVITAIGPLTNIATAIRKDPTLNDRIKRIVIMGGYATERVPEWNILCDPEAADIVFSSGIPVHCVGLDVTLQCTLDPTLMERIHDNPDPDKTLLSLWFERWDRHFGFEKSVMHDPLAVATLVDDVCVFERKRIKVDLKDKRGSIIVLDDSSEDGHVLDVAVEVDRDRFNALFQSVLFNKEIPMPSRMDDKKETNIGG
jgi:purine nucleosidase